MAKSKEDIKYGTAQARLTEDEAVRVAYKHGTPLEGGKIADSEPVDIFSSAHNISKNSQQATETDDRQQQQQQQRDNDAGSIEGGSADFTTGAPRLPKKAPPTMAQKY